MKDKIIKILLFICGLSFWWQARLIVAETFVNSAPFELGRVSLYGLQLLLFATTVFLLGDWIIKGRGLCYSKSWYLTFSVLVIYLVGRVVFANSTILDLSILYQWLLLLIFIFALRHYKNKKYLLFGVLGAGLLLSLWSWGQWLVQGQLASTWLGVASHYPITAGTAVVMDNGLRLLRSYAGLPHPNILGGYLVVIFLLALNYFKTNLNSKNIFYRYSYLFLVGSALMLTFSRSALIAVIVGIFIWYFENKKEKNILQNLGVIIFGLAVFFISLLPIYLNRITLNNNLENKSISERINNQEAYWPMVKNNWLFGLGFSGYQDQIIKINVDLSGFEIQPVHNAGLFLIAQIGLVGLLLVIALIIFSLPQLYLLLPLLIISFFDHYLFSYFSGLVLLFFALLFSDRE